MSKIAIIGATGAAGRKVVQEALSRGHHVTAFVRDKEKLEKLFSDTVTPIVKDVFKIEKEDLSDYEIIINAYSPDSIDKAYLHIDFATKLIAYFRDTEKPRLFFILGAGSLKNGHGGRVLDDLEANKDFSSWINAPRQQSKEYNFLSQVDDVNWVGISPGFLLKDGEKQESILGTDTILYNDKKESETSTGTLAVAILDEIEDPQHFQNRFTVINK